MPRIAPFLTALLMPGAAGAADCLGIGPAGTEARLEIVRPDRGPVPILRSAPDCPAETAACRSGASLNPGNRVVTGVTEGAYRCVTRADARGRVASGWVRADALAPVPLSSAPPRAADWAGRWHHGADRTLRVTATLEGEIVLRAESRVPARPDSRPGASPRPVEARLRPEGRTAALTLAEDGNAAPDDPGTDERCRITLLRRGPYLIVQDNGLCPAAFTGPYRRGG